jgi:hypothetical protein
MGVFEYAKTARCQEVSRNRLLNLENIDEIAVSQNSGQGSLSLRFVKWHGVRKQMAPVVSTAIVFGQTRLYSSFIQPASDYI